MLSIIWEIMEIEVGESAQANNTLRDLHNFSQIIRKPNLKIVLLFIQNNS